MVQTHGLCVTVVLERVKGDGDGGETSGNGGRKALESSGKLE